MLFWFWLNYCLQDPGETALHFAVRTSDQTSLHLVDFLVQNWYRTEYSAVHVRPLTLFKRELSCKMVNMDLCVYSGTPDRQTDSGNTALHYSCTYEKAECLKLLLRGKPSIDLGKWVIFRAATISQHYRQRRQ